ncbi:hypothetical protein OQ279_09505 [Salinimicrobium sp. MT39]|uniref:Phage abortive infection protein n=1 Tax=Salinimicrobium profundisediminis TaxID=2994553 RepID=A0A9X3I1F1_9FLAO|nr:hypothetical protein [Salinimicrobium profundisediminis]MCX2838388.1 hypothetical protein [Salinimicrobium profundisediminis]
MEISKKQIWLLIVIGIVLISFPLLFIQDLGFISFSDKGYIGDRISDTTAIFISFIGSVLLYLTLKAQVKANREIQKRFKIQQENEKLEKLTLRYKERISALSEEIRTFSYTNNNSDSGTKPDFKLYSGPQAISQLLKIRKSIFYGNEWRSAYLLEPKFEELRQLLLMFLSISESLNQEIFTDKTIENREVKSQLISTLKFHYDAKIRGNFLSMEKYKAVDKPCPDCSSTHGIPEDLFEICNSIAFKLQLKLN